MVHTFLKINFLSPAAYNGKRFFFYFGVGLADRIHTPHLHRMKKCTSSPGGQSWARWTGTFKLVVLQWVHNCHV